MFATAIPTIETVQKAKSTFVSTVVTDAKIREPILALVDAETQYAKAVARAVEHLYGQLSEFKIFPTK